ncbi:hypothetical protein F5883DRAFT_634877 [Diaporthe sp. PMI_573]|nr:hypothetical protein F5883DRAFT_634877 [Diaporthaceae sp. PMI_573]
MSSPNADAVFEDIVTEVSGVVQTFVKEWDPSSYQEEELDDPDFNSKKEALDGNQEALDELYEYHNFLKDKDMGNVPEIAGFLQISKANHAERISALPEVDQANLFDKAVARAVVQKVVDGIPKPSLIGLLELLYKILYGPGVPKPDGTLSLEALIDEAEAKLLIIRTKLVSWLREHEKLEEDERLLRLNEPEKQDMLFYIVELLKELLNEPSMEFCNSTSGRDRFDDLFKRFPDAFDQEEINF